MPTPVIEDLIAVGRKSSSETRAQRQAPTRRISSSPILVLSSPPFRLNLIRVLEQAPKRQPRTTRSLSSYDKRSSLQSVRLWSIRQSIPDVREDLRPCLNETGLLQASSQYLRRCASKKALAKTCTHSQRLLMAACSAHFPHRYAWERQHGTISKDSRKEKKSPRENHTQSVHSSMSAKSSGSKHNDLFISNDYNETISLYFSMTKVCA